MLEIFHTESGMWGWTFDCPSAPAIAGAARTYEQSVDRGNHAARIHLERETGQPLEDVDLSAVIVHRA